ncbi:MAG: alpha/beta fold hydrolase [bacterium]|nr:MAG: alpha/beta fold hydrolase [bacterium]
MRPNRHRPGSVFYFYIVILIAAWLLVENLSCSELPVPRFEWTDIPPSMAPAKGEVEFGFLVVRENRGDGGSSRTIRLPVMIAKSRSSEPKPDPILFTTGGPGVMTTLYGGRDLTRWPFLDERDFIYFEQRGALHSQPSLVGPEIDSVVSDAIGKNINGKPEREKLLEAAVRLRDRLKRDGIDLAAYNTTESAYDIEDLRRALQIEQWNLYGISYSCLLMIEVMRNHPEGIRSVILDSPLIPGAKWDETSVGNYWAVLHSMFEACRSDSAVNTAYPELEKRFLELIDEAYRKPIDIVVEHPFNKDSVSVELDGEGIFLAAAHFIENGQYIYGFPYWMSLMCNRDADMLARMATELVSIPPYAWGMRYSIWCNDVFLFEDFDKFSRHDNVPYRLSTISLTVVPPGIFDLWPRNEADPAFTQPICSEIPALVANGQYDPDTPPEWGKELCRTLPNSHYFLFPGQSHLPLFLHPAGRRIAMAFLDNPYERPDDSVIAESPFRFYSGN